jgi:hypothetical protein
MGRDGGDASVLGSDADVNLHLAEQFASCPTNLNLTTWPLPNDPGQKKSTHK